MPRPPRRYRYRSTSIYGRSESVARGRRRSDFQLDDGREALSWIRAQRAGRGHCRSESRSRPAQRSYSGSVSACGAGVGTNGDLAPRYPAAHWFRATQRGGAQQLSRFCAAHLVDLVPALVLHGASLKRFFQASCNARCAWSGIARSASRHAHSFWYERAIAAGLTVSRSDIGTSRSDRTLRSGADRYGDQRRQGSRQRADAGSLRRPVARRCAGSHGTARPRRCNWSNAHTPGTTLFCARSCWRRSESIPDQVRHAGAFSSNGGYAKRMPYGRGVAALFSGPSGTGKSMAAQIIAGDLCTALYRIDLSKTMSKWLRQTEDLSQIFDLARQNTPCCCSTGGRAVRQAHVKDAHDRYANVEVAYLLQRMEDYDGLAILTTNLKQNIDQAFFAPLAFCDRHPVPDADCRADLEASISAASAACPERRFQITGAAGDARGWQHPAERDRRRVCGGLRESGRREHASTMQHIVRATRQELLKLGMLNAELGLAEIASDQSAATGTRA